MSDNYEPGKAGRNEREGPVDFWQNIFFEFLSYLTDTALIGGGPLQCQPTRDERSRDEIFGSKITGSQDF